MQLDADHAAIVRAILRRHVPGREVRAFGSRVANNARRFSDLDLVVLGNDRLPENLKVVLKMEFEDSDLPFRVDVLEWATAPDHLRAAITKLSEPISEPLPHSV